MVSGSIGENGNGVSGSMVSEKLQRRVCEAECVKDGVKDGVRKGWCACVCVSK